MMSRFQTAVITADRLTAEICEHEPPSESRNRKGRLSAATRRRRVSAGKRLREAIVFLCQQLHADAAHCHVRNEMSTETLMLWRDGRSAATGAAVVINDCSSGVPHVVANRLGHICQH